ncbi:hypothetical protein [Streptosporangium minutum]|uniref:hypothetical protein n=1 Tax=Streptosporangium minutum TaxID=569862 RepID=UPI0013FDA4B1|nr:hypothetical protein [Streptosporangium minutum]
MQVVTRSGHRVIAVERDVGRLDVRGIEADPAGPRTPAAAGGALEDAGELQDVQALVHCAGISPVEAVAEAAPRDVAADAGGERWR